MRKGFRVLVTEKCNMACRTCFNRNLRNGQEMSAQLYERLCRWLAEDGGIERMKIMGGEPTTHSEFSSILAAATEHFPSLFLFTNAVNDVVSSVTLREHDSIIYNLACFPKQIKPAKLLPDSSCCHLFETRIDGNMDVESVCRKLQYIYSILDDRMFVNLTVNCIEDIFSLRSEVVENWNAVARFIRDELGCSFNLDHDVPLCFAKGSGMLLDKLRPTCSTACAGLITADMQLRYCNQTQSSLSKIFVDNDFISYDDVDACLESEFQRLMATNQREFCCGCPDFGRDCNGGCFAHKLSSCHLSETSRVQHG